MQTLATSEVDLLKEHVWDLPYTSSGQWTHLCRVLPPNDLAT